MHPELRYAKLHGARQFAAECVFVLHYTPNQALGSHPDLQSLSAEQREEVMIRPKPKTKVKANK